MVFPVSVFVLSLCCAVSVLCTSVPASSNQTNVTTEAAAPTEQPGLIPNSASWSFTSLTNVLIVVVVALLAGIAFLVYRYVRSERKMKKKAVSMRYSRLNNVVSEEPSNRIPIDSNEEDETIYEKQ